MAIDRTTHVIVPELDTTGKSYFSSEPTKGKIELTTGKGYRGGIKSDFSVFHVGDQMKIHVFGTAERGDLSGTVKVVSGVATQKRIDQQHAEVFTPAKIEEIRQQVIAHYANMIPMSKS